jgi:ABC-type lipoprotein export system ATPase subunit
MTAMPGTEPARGAPVIDARGLFHIFREPEVETVALRGADLALDAGSWTSVTGPSGSGKTTLLHVMAGLLEPNGGSVTMDGQDLTRLPPPERSRWRRTRIGVVLQRDNLHPLLDVSGNVALGLRLSGTPRAAVADRVGSLLARVGMSAHHHRLPRQLSGGEAQRAAIAAALAPAPRVLLADELTGELDAATAAGVLDLLESIRDDDGTAVLTVTHNRQVAERADRHLRMRDGQVHGDG